ncbi:MAG: YitT family protein [Anaerolineales bacterium]|nr:YitT family protein [Anaerolineales bacterium]
MKKYWINSRDYILIVLGALIQAVSLRIFFVPADLASGGVSGIAQLINFYTEWPIGLMVLVGNVPPFSVGMAFSRRAPLCPADGGGDRHIFPVDRSAAEDSAVHVLH